MLLAPLFSRNPSLRFLPAAVRIARAAMSASPAESAPKAAVTVEYAKSARSACKGCSAAIAKGALRLGAHGRDPRGGYDTTKWYHVACFPASSHPLGPVEKIPGFDWIKESERDELRALAKPNQAIPPRETRNFSHPMATEARSIGRALRRPLQPRDSNVASPVVAGKAKTKARTRLAAATTPASPPSVKSYMKKPESRVELKEVSLAEELEKARERRGRLRVARQLTDRVLDERDEALRWEVREWERRADEQRRLVAELMRLIGMPEVYTPVESLRSKEERKRKDEISHSGSVNNKRDQTELGPSEEPSPKKANADLSSLEAVVAEKGTVSVEYAKSARSTCKGCNVSIAKGALRLGVAAHDPRGWDSTKWYHVACFPTSSHLLGPVEKLNGFDSIKDDDRVELQELEKNNKRDQAAVSPLEVPSPNKAKPEVEVAEKIQEVNSLATHGASLNKLSSPGNKGVGTVIPFSASHVKKEYKDATLPTHWKAFETVIFREQDDGLRASAKIAAFDFDGCLAKTSVKITGADKWSLQHKSIPDKLQSLYKDGYKLVIFTNESNIERWKNKRQQAVDSKVGRLDNFIECVKVPVQVFIACGVGKGKGTPDDRFRKPNSGMWWLMADHFNSGMAIDMDQSFYVGDAAGRENDHSDADIKFAKDIGLKFHVPEEFFGP